MRLNWFIKEPSDGDGMGNLFPADAPGDARADRTLYLARHGEILKPATGKIYIGQMDLPLTPQGRIQAENLSEQLADARLCAIYTSDLKRCVETARIIARRQACSPVIFPPLREINLGRWEGLPFETVRKKYPHEYEKRGENIAEFRPPGGESFRDLDRRVISALKRIFRVTRGDILIVAHAGVNRIILTRAMKRRLKDLFAIPQTYGGLNLLKFASDPFFIVPIEKHEAR